MAEGSFRYRCEPAYSILNALGGVRAVARFLALTPETVSQWNRPAERGGLGGFIPKRHWPAILSLAGELGVGQVTYDTLKTGTRERLDMGRASKIKGDRFEFQVVRELKEAGYAAHRVPLSGAVEGYPGDVRIDLPDRVWLLQCKISASGSSGGRTVVTRFLHDAAIGRIITKHGTYIGLSRKYFFWLLKGERPWIANMPEMNTSGTGISNDIEGHDALVFRRDKVTEWNALVREADYFKATQQC